MAGRNVWPQATPVFAWSAPPSRCARLAIRDRSDAVDYCVIYEERTSGMGRVFAMVRAGSIKPKVGQVFALKDAADAHRALEARETQGATVLVV